MDKAEIIEQLHSLNASQPEQYLEEISNLKEILQTRFNLSPAEVNTLLSTKMDAETGLQKTTKPLEVSNPANDVEVKLDDEINHTAPTEVAITEEPPEIEKKVVEQVINSTHQEKIPVIEDIQKPEVTDAIETIETDKSIKEGAEQKALEATQVAKEKEPKKGKENNTSEVEALEKLRETAPNIEAKTQIIEDLKKILKTDRKSLRKAYDKAKAIQNRWKKSGHNKSKVAHELESKYKYNLELFHHNANITRQFIELDFDKNLTAKKELIAKVVELQKEENVEQIERKVNHYKKEWFRSGPVKHEVRDEIKSELDAAIAALDGKIEAFYKSRKELLVENLQKKIDLFEKVNVLRGEEVNSPKAYQHKTKEIQAVQQEWRNIGRSLENDKVWGIFQKACDAFFDKKREFFMNLSAIRKDNKVKKQEIIAQAEKLKTSTDWKNASAQIINLQKKWKQIGGAQPAEDQRLWKKFRGFCDEFFNAKTAHYKKMEASYGENLALKEELIKKLDAFTPGGNQQENIKAITAFEKEWQQIGYVPIKKKGTIQNAYNKALNTQYDAMNLTKAEREKTRFESKIKAMGGQANNAFKNERFKLRQQLERIEKKLTQYKNNINFFSGNPDSPLLKGIQKQIDDAQRQYNKIEEKLTLLNDIQNKAEIQKRKATEKSGKEEE